MKDPTIRHAASNVGGVTKLSRALGLSRAAVSGWRRVPAERVLDVERLTGISRTELRPDLYPPARTQAQASSWNGTERRRQMRG